MGGVGSDRRGLTLSGGSGGAPWPAFVGAEGSLEIGGAFLMLGNFEADPSAG